MFRLPWTSFISRFTFSVFAVVAVFLVSATVAGSTELVVVGDTKLKPVSDVVGGIGNVLKSGYTIYTPAEARGRLNRIVAREGARAVIALGKEAIDEALQLPSSIAVIYDLVILPVRTNRPNTTGVYMATPVSEYLNVTRRFFPSLKSISAVTTPELHRALGGGVSGQVTFHHVANPFDLVKTVQQKSNADAILLLPDLSLLTSAALEEIYLFSFRNKVPLLGVSEKHVKQGALFALVFDPVAVGKQLGEMALDSLREGGLGGYPPSPSRRFDLYLNADTAKKMGIHLPEDLVRRAKRVYP